MNQLERDQLAEDMEDGLVFLREKNYVMVRRVLLAWLEEAKK